MFSLLAWATEEGDSARSVSIECDGALVLVTKNCESALRRLREVDAWRILWIDAICINQDDLKERAQQVVQMRDIYSRANEVLICLGEASANVDETTQKPCSDLFMDYLAPMGREIAQLMISKGNPTTSPLYQGLISEVHGSNGHSPLSPSGHSK